MPTYYCDGELNEGLEVMVDTVILDSSTDLFGSGKSESFDYAVIRSHAQTLRSMTPQGMSLEISPTPKLTAIILVGLSTPRSEIYRNETKTSKRNKM